MLQSTNKNIDANLYKPSKKKLHCVDSGDYWPTSIKETIQRSTFLTIMEYTANIMEKNEVISSLLRMFAMFEIRLSYKKVILDVIYLKCINCKRETGLDLKTSSLIFDEITTKFLLNAILHHVGMSWIIISNKEMKYDMDKNNHHYWLNKGPWYSTPICLRLHGSTFEDFIKQARTDRYNFMCSLVAHDKIQPDYEDDEISLGDRSIPKDATPESLGALGATINFIDIWLKLFLEN